MAKFIKITTLYRGTEEEMILNVDDISCIAIGPNTIFLKEPFASGVNYVSVSSKTIEKLEAILDVQEAEE